MKATLIKILSFVIMLTMMLGLCSCASNSTVDKVYVVQMVENGAFDQMREGFIKQLRDNGYSEEKLEIVYKCAQGDATNMNTIVQEALSENPIAVATVGTPATQAFVAAGSDVPTFFISVGDPVGAGVISDMSAAPDKNATGTSNAVPVNEIFDLADKLTPDITTYGILYTTGEANSVYTATNAKEYLEGKGIKVIEQTVTSAGEVQQAAISLCQKVDAIFVPNDSIIQSAMPLVAQASRDAKVPVYGSSAVMVDSGAFATIAISDTKIGAITADKLIEYLNGTAITNINAQIVDADDIVINSQTATAIGVSVSDDMKNSARFVTDTNQ